MRIRTLIVGATAAVGIAGAVSANQASDRIHLAQAQDSGAQSGAGQRSSTGNRESGGAATRGSEGRGATAPDSGGGRAAVRDGTTATSRTVVRERSGGTRVSVRGGSRAAVGVRTAATDDAIVIKRKKARRYVYSEPSMTVIKKKRYTTYREPSSAVIVKKRRPGIAVRAEYRREPACAAGPPPASP
jgi:hypothetical protein